MIAELITASDGFGSSSLEFTIEVVNVNDPPTIISAATVAAVEDRQFLYIGQAADPDDSLLTWQFRDYPGWLTANADSLFGTPGQTDKDTGFVVIVSDGEFSDTLTVSITLTLVNDPPVITSAASVQATEDERFLYIAAASDEEDAPLDFTFDQLPSWLSADADSVFGMPLESDRDTSFRVIVTDGANYDTLKVAITVIAINDPPVIAAMPDTGFFEDERLVLLMKSVQTYINDPDTPDSLLTIEIKAAEVFTLSQQADSICILAEQNWFGCDTALITVSDGEYTDSAQFVLTVYPVNDAPAFTELLPDSLILEQGQTDSLLIDGLAVDVDTPDSLLI